MVDWDGDTGTGEDVCRIGWTFNFDPLVMYEFYPSIVPGDIEAGVGGTDLEFKCESYDYSHYKNAPAGWAGNTSRIKCYIQEDDWDSSPEGDITVTADKWEASVYWKTQTITGSSDTSARTGDHAVTLQRAHKWNVVSGVCTKSTDANEVSGEVLFTIEEASSSVPNAGSDCSGDADIDGDDVCDSDDNDNCSGFWGHNPTQADTDEDGYGNMCDSDWDEDCALGASDLSAIANHYGDAADDTPYAWCGHGTCTVSHYTQELDANDDGEIDSLDHYAAFKHYTTIGPSNGTSPSPSCE